MSAGKMRATVPGDLFQARVIVTRAVDAIGRTLSVGECTDLLADNTEWPTAYCHSVAHELMPGRRCMRAACELNAPASETAAVDRARDHAHAARYGSESLGGSDDE